MSASVRFGIVGIGLHKYLRDESALPFMISVYGKDRSSLKDFAKYSHLLEEREQNRTGDRLSVWSSISIRLYSVVLFRRKAELFCGEAMDIVAARSLQFSTFGSFERLGAKHGDSLKLSPGFREEEKRLQVFVSANWQSGKPLPSRRTRKPLKVACSYNNSPAFTLEAGGFKGSIDEELILKDNSQEFEQHLNGRCIYLVGMMGSGKTTVGKKLSQVLNYDFCDCDDLVEDEVGGTSVADIFKHCGEGFFRDKETGVLQKLSVMNRLVIATGGGAVIRPINWKYMHKGVSIWLDVPIDALARRITAEGTKSRPLLHNETEDEYTQTLMRLSSLLEARVEAYANANTRVSLENIAAKLADRDVLDLSPTTIAIEALMQIMSFLKREDGHYAGC